MNRRRFFAVVAGLFAALPTEALAASKKPTPKPSAKKTPVKATPAVKPSSKSTPAASTSPTATQAQSEFPVTKDGVLIKIDSIVAPISLYGVVTKNGREYPVLVAKPTDRTLKVFTARCPHQGNILNLAERNEFSCDWHGARFEEATGKVIDGPTRNSLESYEVVDRAGALYVKF